jgi:2,3-dihydroxyphenylpropionate 1,2-dioxygenase
MQAFDTWEDAQILSDAGIGGGEIREWIAALAAAHAAGTSPPQVDYYEAGTCIGVAAVVVHAAPAGSAG